MYIAIARLDTPAISKSTASPFACCDVFFEPIASHNSSDLNPLVIVTALSSNLAVALWIENNVDFDQLILEFYTGEPNSGWIHVSYKDGSNRKQVLTFDGKSYTNGLPEAKWSDGKLTN